jgi:preprotein translocase subunit SecA
MPAIPFPRLVNGFLSFWGSAYLKALAPGVQQIDDNAALYSSMSHEEILTVSLEQRERGIQGMGPESVELKMMALASESIYRVFHFRLFREQLLAARALFRESIVQMETGEGKTFVIPLAVCAHVTLGTPIVVTCANEYLAERDYTWMRDVYRSLGITASLVTAWQDTQTKRHAYAADVIYISADTLMYDFLSTFSALHRANVLPIPFSRAIIDEIDVVLIDKGDIRYTTGQQIDPDGAPFFMPIWEATAAFESGKHFTRDRGQESVELTEFGKTDLIRRCAQLSLPSPELLYLGRAALQARWVLQKDSDYITADNLIVPLDRITGRALAGTSFGYGAQTFLEIKEALPLTGMFASNNWMNMLSLFSRFKSLAGLSGSAKHNAIEYSFLIGRRVTAIQPHSRLQRKDLPDLVFKSKTAQLAYAINSAREYSLLGGASLIGTTNVRDAEELGQRLAACGAQVNVLTARNAAEEARIISLAGQTTRITVASQLAGRGVDIKPDSSVLQAGGLLVIGIGRNIDRRLDDQLKGRTGRQGQPGRTIFLLSPQDDIHRFNNIPLFSVPYGGDADLPLGGNAALLAADRVAEAQRANVLLRYYRRDQERLFFSLIEEFRGRLFLERTNLLRPPLVKGAPADLIRAYVSREAPETIGNELLVDKWLSFGNALASAPLDVTRGFVASTELSDCFVKLFRKRKKEVYPYGTARTRLILVRSIDLAWGHYLEEVWEQFALINSLQSFGSKTRTAAELVSVFASLEQECQHQRRLIATFHLMRINDPVALQSLKFWRNLGSRSDYGARSTPDGIPEPTYARSRDPLSSERVDHTSAFSDFASYSGRRRPIALADYLLPFLAYQRHRRQWTPVKLRWAESVLQTFTDHAKHSPQKDNRSLSVFAEQATEFCETLHLQGVGWLARRRQRIVIYDFLQYITSTSAENDDPVPRRMSAFSQTLKAMASPLVLGQLLLVIVVCVVYAKVLSYKIPFSHGRVVADRSLPASVLDMIVTGYSWRNVSCGIGALVPLLLVRWRTGAGFAELSKIGAYLYTSLVWGISCAIAVIVQGGLSKHTMVSGAGLAGSVILATAVLTILQWVVQQTEVRGAKEAAIIVNVLIAVNSDIATSGSRGAIFGLLVLVLFVVYELSAKWSTTYIFAVRVGAYDAIKRCLRLSPVTVKVSMESSSVIAFCTLMLWASAFEIAGRALITAAWNSNQQLALSLMIYVSSCWTMVVFINSKLISISNITKWLASGGLELAERQEGRIDAKVVVKGFTGALYREVLRSALSMVVLVAVFEALGFKDVQRSGVLVCGACLVAWAAGGRVFSNVRMSILAASSSHFVMNLYDGIKEFGTRPGESGAFVKFILKVAGFIATLAGIAGTISKLIDAGEKLWRWLHVIIH